MAGASRSRCHERNHQHAGPEDDSLGDEAIMRAHDPDERCATNTIVSSRVWWRRSSVTIYWSTAPRIGVLGARLGECLGVVLVGAGDSAGDRGGSLCGVLGNLTVVRRGAASERS
jgi:hypothetical protein